MIILEHQSNRKQIVGLSRVAIFFSSFIQNWDYCILYISW